MTGLSGRDFKIFLENRQPQVETRFGGVARAGLASPRGGAGSYSLGREPQETASDQITNPQRGVTRTDVAPMGLKHSTGGELGIFGLEVLGPDAPGFIRCRRVAADRSSTGRIPRADESCPGANAPGRGTPPPRRRLKNSTGRILRHFDRTKTWGSRPRFCTMPPRRG